MSIIEYSRDQSVLHLPDHFTWHANANPTRYLPHRVYSANTAEKTHTVNGSKTSQCVLPAVREQTPQKLYIYKCHYFHWQRNFPQSV